MKTEFTNITSLDSLFTVLRATDISVPLQTEGQTTGHVERWIICRLLATLGKQGRLDFPLELKHPDRPDFLLRSGLAKIGVETSKLVPEQYAAYSALAEREFPDTMLDPGLFRRKSPRRTPDKMRSFLRDGRLLSKPWVRDGPEREWAGYFEDRVRDKLAKLADPGFAKFPLNWLALYDALPLSIEEVEKALSYASSFLNSVWASSPTFDVIYVERDDSIHEISRHGSQILPLEDLW